MGNLPFSPLFAICFVYLKKYTNMFYLFIIVLSCFQNDRHEQKKNRKLFFRLVDERMRELFFFFYHFSKIYLLLE